MGQKTRTPVPFGGGLDREAGVMVAPPTSMEDLRNVLLHQGKYLVRRGFKNTVTLKDGGGSEMTHVLAGQALRTTRTAVYIGYNDVNGKVEVFRGDSFGTAALWLATWFTLTPGDPPPIIHMAESYGRVFFAHDDPVVTSRQQTYFYDSATDAISGLVSDLRGMGNEPVRFRGVVQHLDYLWGWGYGTEGENRPELVRVSVPGLVDGGGNPTFKPEHYFVVGDRNDPVVRCIPAGGTLLAYKETQTHECFGYSHATFGTRPLDPLYGLPASRLAVNVSGLVFAWTNEGPRLYDGSWGSDSLELPLELPQPEPSDLVEPSELRYAFAEYLPNYRVVLFFFGPRVYALTVRVRGDWKWAWWEIGGFEPFCGFRLPATGSGLLSPPTGFPSNPLPSAIMDTEFDLTVTNNAQAADEYLEVWGKPTGGSWQILGTFIVSPNPTDLHHVTGVQPGTYYDLAVRYRRGPYYTAGYTSSDPSTWPASAQGNVTTTLSLVPTIDDAVWSRTSSTTEQVLVTVTPAYPGIDVEIRRGGATIHTETAPTGQFQFADTGLDAEALNNYRVRHVTADVNGPESADTFVWGGPAPAPSALMLASNETDSYTADWTNGRNDLETEVWDDWDRVGHMLGAFPETLVATKTPGTAVHDETYADYGGNTLTVGVRHKQTTFGVDDFSAFVSDTVLVTA